MYYAYIYIQNEIMYISITRITWVTAFDDICTYTDLRLLWFLSFATSFSSFIMAVCIRWTGILDWTTGLTLILLRMRKVRLRT